MARVEGVKNTAEGPITLTPGDWETARKRCRKRPPTIRSILINQYGIHPDTVSNGYHDFIEQKTRELSRIRD